MSGLIGPLIGLGWIFTGLFLIEREQKKLNRKKAEPAAAEKLFEPDPRYSFL